MTWPFDRPRVPRSYARGVLIAFDRLVNAVTRGDPDLSVSQQNAIRARQGKRLACIICRLLDRFAPNHCEASLTGATLPPA